MDSKLGDRDHMDTKLGWALAVVGVALGYAVWGWQGVVLAVSVMAFWLLLQFSRALRAMKTAADSPLGFVASAVMFQSRLKPGLAMLQVVALTHSLGCKLGASGDVWRWADGAGNSVTLTFTDGKLTAWVLERPADVAACKPVDPAP